MPRQQDAEKSRAVALGTLIRQARRGRGLSQRQLAAELPMSQGHVSRIEAGEHAPPADDILIRIAKALDLDPRELLRAAGRQAAGPTFEELVLDRLDALTEAIDGLHEQIAEQGRLLSEIERRRASSR